MSKKDYIAFAKLLHNHPEAAKAIEGRAPDFDVLVSGIADIFEADNPLFDRDRFFLAVYHGKITARKVPV